MYDFEENRATKRIQKENVDKLTFDDKSETNDEVHFDSNKVFSIDPKFVLADSNYEGDIFPDDTKIEKPTRLNIIPSDDSSQETDDDEDIPLEESFISVSSSSEIWTLPSGQNVGDIYTSKIFENTRATKKKKKLTAVEKAILRYSASNIIDLSAHMKEWFCVDDRKFMSKDYESMLQIPELAPEESSFVLKVEEFVRKGKVDQAYKHCMDTHITSEKNSFLYKSARYMATLFTRVKTKLISWILLQKVHIQRSM
ncbi:hypothetical protein C2G38_134939 [Gigaspora rosea]|uniref:Uncharacterized protein n=1 Tax=Gigaspora rosea TaxID=44941 RepID=A0A397UPG4_9GLOM|nr:hypothetical protein C2G38_134939 [Gigaspora rosea]